MRKRLGFWLCVGVALCCLVAGALRGQEAKDVTGTWQGTLAAGPGLRIVVKISQADGGGGLKAVTYSIDQGGQAIPASALTMQGSAVKMTIVGLGVSYEGKLSADGKAITGTWAQGGNPLPLNLVRATAETAWEIAAPAPPPKLMAAGADPSFEVATIKPNNSGATSMQELTVNGRNFRTRNSSLGDLISFAYQVQAKQVVGGPEWIDKDRYDIAAVPDKEGAPNPEQVRTMIRKLLAERFKVTFHHEQRELPAFVLTVAKGGPKLTPTQMPGPLPGIGFGPGAGGITMGARNATIGEVTGFLQTLVLDRPVVDQTGLTAKYDFQLTFAPDETQFGGHAPGPPGGGAADTGSAAPGLFQAVQEQLGLKLEAKKTQVDVLALDHVEKPSGN